VSITTHVLDTSIGQPARAVPVRLEQRGGDGMWWPVGEAVTDADGRVAALVPPDVTLAAGTYRLTFDTGAYFAARAVASFYQTVAVEFIVQDPGAHYHVPLLVSPFGYTTYRGS
jgi:5-hydroxyisourate hydrolase